MKTISLNSNQSARITALAVIGLISVLFIGDARASIKIEQVQREYQARYYFLTGTYASWPGCSCGMPAPAFPPDGFYGNLDENPGLALVLVRDLAGKFYHYKDTGNGSLAILVEFYNSPDGTLNIEGAASDSDLLRNYVLGDMPPTIGGADMRNTDTIATNNYLACFGALTSYIEKLNWIACGYWKTNMAAAVAQGLSTNDCGTAKDLAASGWKWYEDPGRTDGSLGQATICSKHTDDDYVVTYNAFKQSTRGRFLAPICNAYPRLEKGSVRLYLNLSPNSAGIGETQPPVTVDEMFHSANASEIAKGGAYLSPMFGDGEPGIAGDCPEVPPWPTCGWYTYGSIIILGPHFDTTADQIYCGDGSCSSGSCKNSFPGALRMGDSGPNLWVSLGPDERADTYGYFYVRATQPGQSLYSPEGLLYVTPGTIASASNLQGPLVTDKTAAYVTTGGGGYTISFYEPQGSPAVFQASVSVVSNASFGQMVVTHVVGNHTRTYGLNYTTNSTTSGTWDVIAGNGILTRAHFRSWDSSGNETRILRTKNALGIVVSETTDLYTAFPWGLALVQRSVGSGGSAEVTSTRYHADTNRPGSYGQVALRVEPSGRWERYQYDTLGRLTNKVVQVGNNPTNSADSANRVTQVSYSNNVTLTVETFLGTDVSRTYEIHASDDADQTEQVQTIRCAVAGAGLGASGNLTNIAWRTTSASNPYTAHAGDVLAELNPDGTMTFHQYTAGVTTLSSGDPGPGWSWGQKVSWSPASGYPTVNGTSTSTTVGGWGEPLVTLVKDIFSNITLSYDTYTYDSNDPLRRSHTLSHLDGTTEEYHYSCCGLDTYTDRDGVGTTYLYDDAGRQVGSSRLGIITTNVLDAAGNVLKTLRIGTDLSPITLRRAAYDSAGNLTSETNALSGPTVYTETRDGSGQTVKTTMYPDEGTRIETYFQDGSLQSVTGTAALPVYYEYGVDANGAYVKETKGSSNGSEWTKTYTDMLGRSYKTVYASATGAPYSISYYNTSGQLTNQIDPDGVSTIYAYNNRGEQCLTVLDTNRNHQIDYAGEDRITFTTNDVVAGNHGDVRRSRVYVWSGASTISNLVSMVETSTDGKKSWTTTYRDSSTEVVTSRETGYGGGRSETTIAPDGSYTISGYSSGRLATTTRYNSAHDPISTLVYGYDPHGRQSTITDARTGTTSYGYNAADQLVSVTTPAPGPGQPRQTTLTDYDTSLRAWKITQPDGTSVYNEYHANGLLRRTYGSRTYPVGYGYDHAGRMQTMTNFGSGAGARVTTWSYDGYRGWLESKVYPGDVAGPSYTYTAAGRLETRHWARGITTTYGYSQAGDLNAVTYDDGATPALGYSYDRRGRQTGTTRGGSAATARTLNDAGQVQVESWNGGTLGGLSVTNGYDQYLRRTELAALNSTTRFLRNSYGYDEASRLQTVTDQSTATPYSATYSYLSNSPLVGQIVFKQDTAVRMTTSKQYDHLNRLTSISSVAGSSTVGYTYAYNSANQRIRSTLADGSYWLYEYDALGQVKSGKRYWSDQTPVAGQQFEYGFDDIGNRTQAKAGGDQNGANLRSANYSANNLNQYTTRDVSGAVDIMGIAFATNTVTVNSQDTYRKGEYFRKELPVGNGSGPVWQSVSIADGHTTVTGNGFVPKAQELFYYDADGNLTNDGRWTYIWDAENRLVKMTPNAGVGPQISLLFEYDVQGRRIHKQVWANTNWTGYATNDVKFLYDGWNLLAELNGTNNALIRLYAWGTDLSGSMQGAGGVGGLLFIDDRTTAVGRGAPAYDGNGNVIALVSMSGGTNCATYEYGPFGEVIRATGPMAKANPFRWSTQYTDDETDLVCYLHRYYNPSTGRWLSRDPIAELGFRKVQSARLPRPSTREEQNLYGFVGNNPVSKVDSLGLKITYDCTDCGPDVTRNVDRALLRAEMKFWQADQIKKHNACASLYDVAGIFIGSGGGVNAWDITEVYEAGATPGRLFETSCGFTRGRGKCADGLTFRGGCYHASAINYALWGRMNKACGEASALYGWGEDYSLSTANRWALWYKWAVQRDFRWSMTDQVMMFTEYGYNGSFAGGSTTQLSCSPNKCKATGEFGWHWRGLN